MSRNCKYFSRICTRNGMNDKIDIALTDWELVRGSRTRKPICDIFCSEWSKFSFLYLNQSFFHTYNVQQFYNLSQPICENRRLGVDVYPATVALM